MTAQIKRDENGQMWVRQDDHLTWIKAKMVDASPDGSIVVETGDETGYNGWVNYETWCVHLWLTSDQYAYHDFRDLIGPGDIEEVIRTAQYDLQEHGEKSYVGTVLRGMFADLLTSSLQSVDWYAVYDALHEGDE